MKQLIQAVLVATAILTSSAVTAFAADPAVSHVNGSINIAADQHAGKLSTVNGSIDVAARATVGSMHSVNGHLTLGDRATAADMSTVNGAIELGKGARVTGALHAVNGSLKLAPGAQVGGGASNVNGAIDIDGAHVVGRVATVGGNITLSHSARLDGGILVQKPTGYSFSFKPGVPRIVIGVGCSIAGTLKFERDVKLYISDQATILGKIEGATPITFTGATPPR